MAIHFPNLKPIQAVISFSTDGQMKPIYLCIDGITLKVASSKQFIEFGSPVFVCQVIDDDTLKEVKVHYHKTENVWTIPR